MKKVILNSKFELLSKKQLQEIKGSSGRCVASCQTDSDCATMQCGHKCLSGGMCDTNSSIEQDQ